MDISHLSQTVVDLLSPCMPNLVDAGENAVKEVASKLESSTLDLVRILWNKIKLKLGNAPAFQDLAKNPENEGAKAILKQQVLDIFSKDEAFRSEITKLMKNKSVTCDTTSIQKAGNGSIQVAKARDIIIDK